MSDQTPVYEVISTVGLDDSGYYAVFTLSGPNGDLDFALSRDALNELAEAALMLASTGADIGDGKRLTDAFRARSMGVTPESDGPNLVLNAGIGKMAQIRIAIPPSVALQLEQALQQLRKP